MQKRSPRLKTRMRSATRMRAGPDAGGATQRREDVSGSQGKSGTPSRNFLFDPASNIDTTGTAYLAMLNNVYLSGIENPTSRRYAVITAYNGGAQAAYYAYSRTIRFRPRGMINRMSPGMCVPDINHPTSICGVAPLSVQGEFRPAIVSPPINAIASRLWPANDRAGKGKC